MRSGILLIDKAAGLSSAQVVAKLKRTLSAEKVGHAGTLDPDATGLLICLVNGATRVASAGSGATKVYEGTLRLGVTTSTDDMSGDVLERCATLPESQEVLARSRTLVGAISQIPPRVSAIRIEGKRAYDLERKGAEFTLAARPVHVYRFDLEPFNREQYRYVIECSAGTYVRSLARDLGELLGCGGAVETIRRTRSGPLCISDAVQLEDVSWDHLTDWSALFPETPRIALPHDVALALLGGKEAALKVAAAHAIEAGIKPEIEQKLIYTSLDANESWGLLEFCAGDTLRFVVNIVKPKQD